MRAASNRSRRPTRRSILALAWALWVVLVQALGGTAALVHAHGGAGEHLHLVASQVRDMDHAEWHRRAHAVEDSERDTEQELSDGALELLLEFPIAPQLGRGERGGDRDIERDVETAARELAPCVWFACESVDARALVSACASARGWCHSRAGPPSLLPLRI
ncbi:MAG: hypothetical protein FJ298_04785 [Planctomycetes bacterium]|nr:hypothetical protein [Planctomycetota bacterium]